jgi:hypothetical protein
VVGGMQGGDTPLVVVGDDGTLVVLVVEVVVGGDGDGRGDSPSEVHPAATASARVIRANLPGQPRRGRCPDLVWAGSALTSFGEGEGAPRVESAIRIFAGARCIFPLTDCYAGT